MICAKQEPTTSEKATSAGAGRMKVLIATQKTQGRRYNDFCWCEEGELVTPGFVCGRDTGPDGGCGCGRSFSGVETHKATTTFLVAESKLTKEELIAHIYQHLGSSWGDIDKRTIAEERVESMLEVADAFDVGDVLEFRYDSCAVRETES